MVTEMTSHYVYRKSDGRFLGGGFYDVQPPLKEGLPDPEGHPTQVPDYDLYGVAEFNETHPDPRMERFDATLGKRPATAQEIAAYDADQLNRDAALTWDSVSGRAIRAATAAVFWQITGALPTTQQANAMRTKFLTVFKAL